MKDILNIPDLAFVRYCQKNYGVNRGVYNTIEQWFYECGISKVQERRAMILLFLKQLKTSNEKCKFGAGGLKQHLQIFGLSSMTKKASHS